MIGRHAGAKDLTGKRYTKLTVIKIQNPELKKGKIKWYCLCDCGNTHIVASDLLQSKKTKSCGCLKAPGNKNPNRKEAMLKMVFNQFVRKPTKERFGGEHITFEQFCELSFMPCHYCNRIGSKKVFDRSYKKLSINKGVVSSEFILINGLDRKDSTIGYTLENIVPCCTACNTAKLEMSYDEFKDFISRIYNHFCKKERGL